MTKKDLFNEWERQEPLELDKEKLGTAFSKVLKKWFFRNLVERRSLYC